MGEIADSLINGEFDFYTGEYIGKPCGYPRTFDGRLPGTRKRKKYPKNDVLGVTKYLVMKGIVEEEEIVSTVFRYAIFKKWELTETTTVNDVCTKIQTNFNDFRSWLGNNSPTR